MVEKMKRYFRGGKEEETILILKIVGIILLSLLATVAFMIVAFGLLSRFTYWLYSHHAAKIAMVKKLLRISPHDITKHSDSPRYDSQPEVWCERCFDKAYQWVSGVIRKSKVKANRDCQGSRKSKRCHTTVTIDFPYKRLPRTLMAFSQRHIRTIVNWIRRRVNESGKEPTGKLCVAKNHQPAQGLDRELGKGYNSPYSILPYLLPPPHRGGIIFRQR
jgi:hypothetical protein